MRRLNCLPVVHLGHSPHSSTPQSRILVAVPPTVDCSLDQTSLTSQARIQLCQCPTYGVALGLVMKSVSFVLVLVAACTGIDAILCLEILWQIVYTDRLNVATNRVLHFHPVARVLKRDPLDTILILSDHERRSCRNWAWSSVGVDVLTPWSSRVHVRCTNWRTLGRSLWRT